MFECLRNAELIRQDNGKWKQSAWLWEATDARNEATHNKPYGLRFAEKMGYIKEVDKSIGLFRYYRPIYVRGDCQGDVLSYLSEIYRKFNQLSTELIDVAGYDTSMIQLTDEDILSLSIIWR